MPGAAWHGATRTVKILYNRRSADVRGFLEGVHMASTAEIEQECRKTLEMCVQALEPMRADVLSLIDDFIRASLVLGPLDHYKIFPAPARSIVDAFGAQHGPAALRLFLRAAIARAAAGTLASARYKALPPLTAVNQARNLLRIGQDRDAQVEWLDLNNDLFQKEFGIASLRLYAAGALLVDFRCGVPRSIVTREGVARALPKLLTMLRIGGFRPFFQLHVHKFNLDAFNEKGREECYLCCAELHDVHPEVLGTFGSSWYYDPQLATISPRLDYLRTMPTEGGAKMMFMVAGGEAIGNATSKSATRRQLYEEGKYMPSNYMMVWGRDALRAWAKRRLAAQAG